MVIIGLIGLSLGPLLGKTNSESKPSIPYNVTMSYSLPRHCDNCTSHVATRRRKTVTSKSKERGPFPYSSSSLVMEARFPVTLSYGVSCNAFSPAADTLDVSTCKHLFGMPSRTNGPQRKPSTSLNVASFSWHRSVGQSVGRDCFILALI